MSQGNKVRVFFTKPRHYDMLDDDNNNGKIDSGEAVTSRSIDFPGVTVVSNNNPIFHPRGTASSLATVKISNSAGEKAITVSITGRVKVKTPS